MKQLKILVAILLVLHAVLSILQGFDWLNTLDLVITIVLAFLVAKMDKED
ncbi:TPA: hypothetical protein ACGO7B_001226 [Streptococcus suis]